MAALDPGVRADGGVEWRVRAAPDAPGATHRRRCAVAAAAPAQAEQKDEKAAHAEKTGDKEEKESANPYLRSLDKRLRALRKKYSKVIALKEQSAKGGALNPEQREVLASEHAVNKELKDFEDLRKELGEVQKQDRKSVV